MNKSAKNFALLRAASILAEQGREASAQLLRMELHLERMALTISKKRPNIERTTDKPKSTEIRVAALLDEFSANSFEKEFNGIHLHPNNWRSQFEEFQPQVFFCESAWSGRDSLTRPWKGRVYASSNFKNENRQDLLDILTHCRSAGIPTVFWNKEDPAHFPDRVHDFVKTATEFDHIFTTAIECIPSYRSQYGLSSVHTLPFATNPRAFNPIDLSPRSDAVTFAGSWYANHAGRSRDMEKMLCDLRQAGYDLEIYDRYYGDNDPLHKWPDEYKAFIRPSVPHDQIAAVYKRSRLALNINTVTDSRSMFARRVYELMSSNTLVLSNYSVGMEEMFGQDVIFCDRNIDRLKSLSDSEIDDMRERNLNLVLSKHTYRNRWEEILRIIGLPFQAASEPLTIIWLVNSDADADRAIAWFQQEADTKIDRLLIIAQDMDPLKAADLYESHNRYGITVSSLTHAESSAIEGSYAPVETDHAALIDVSNLPPSGWLSQARLHLQYAEGYAISPRAVKESSTLLFEVGQNLDSQVEGKTIYV